MKKILFSVGLCLLLTACGNESGVIVENSATPGTPVLTISAQPTASSKLIPTATPTSDFRLPSSTWSIPVLMYHHIGAVPDFAQHDAIRKGLTVSTKKLAADLDTLDKLHYTPITFEQMSAFLKHELVLPKKPIILTFDDGYDDNFTDALPLLKQHSMAAVFYIITDKVGTGGYMNWEQIKELATAGHEIGSHTRTHTDLAVISANTNKLRAEVVESKAILEAHGLGPIVSFCYPSGSYNQAVVQLVEKNYAFARTTKAGMFTAYSRRGEIGTVRMEEGVNLGKILESKI